MAKTISVYDKGCVMGMLLDLKIRHETKNKRSLDDVMRALYKKYYQLKNRGFTDLEFQQECESVAGVPLKELLSYTTTVAGVNYPKYLSYAGLKIDTATKALPNLTMGAEVSYHAKHTSWIVRILTWPSSAFTAGIKAGDKITEVNGIKAGQSYFKSLMTDGKPGDQLQLQVLSEKKTKTVTVILSTKYEKTFNITQLEHPDALQVTTYKNWLR